MAKAPTAAPPVSIRGIDATLIRIEGKFSTELDKRVLNLQGRFIREMDRAASQVFKSMAVDSQVGGNVARRVMGSHAGTPSFLVSEGANWEPLSEDYLKRKKRMVSGNSKEKNAGKVKSTFFWEYTGSLRKAFRSQTERMARQSNNTQRYASIQNKTTGVYSLYQKSKPADELFKPLKMAAATGKNTGTRSKNYDFVYSETASGPSITYSGNQPGKSGVVPDRYVKQMNRYIQFDVFNGYAQYIKDTLEGKSASSPEDYVSAMSAGSRPTGSNNKRATFNPSTARFEQKLTMGIKLFYMRSGVKHQRQMIQPYMRYYFKKIMVPLSKKLLQGKF